MAMNREGGAQPVVDPFGDRLRAGGRSLSPSALRVVKFIDRNRIAALASSAMELAACTGTSDATVVRAVQALGFEGLPELKQALASSLKQRSTPADDMRRTMADVGDAVERAIDDVIETHRVAIEGLRSPDIRQKVADAVSTLHRADRIVTFGIGPSALLARYVALLLSRCGRRARSLDATGIALADQLLDLREGDALLVLAYGRPYREVTATFAVARRLHLPIVLVTDSLDWKLARRADVVIQAQRGRAGRVALHGTTLVALEAIVLGLAASQQERAVGALQRLNDLREAVGGIRADLGP
jgi:DNA-binding MurR/RpiR family transcriptional regulator